MSRLSSNSLSVSAEAIRGLLAESEALALESIDKAIEAGRLLTIARDECAHGQWLPFLKRAGVAERQAQRMMQLARSGLKSDTVSDLGGIKSTLKFLSERRLPKQGEALSVTCHSAEANPFRSELAAFVWPTDEHPGHYFVAGSRSSGADGTSVLYTKRAISGEDILCGDGRFMNPVWALVERSMVVPPSNWHFYPEREGVSDVIASILAVEHDRCIVVADLNT
ncbi:DUF3102 domain-containing protein [Ensifer adhaerens]|uniref:DUF3102 domain-containing protein n=1 Tax=Ensifer canadensis TaxID=555315 RepID=UPI00148F4EA3|nr:DUF3102 domain-containing protein [Ensifer canadensis]NOV21653.1 DUF3102 domain-containing protein [Ensifer canadensis]